METSEQVRFCGLWSDGTLERGLASRLLKIKETKNLVSVLEGECQWIREEQEKRKPKPYRAFWTDAVHGCTAYQDIEARNLSEALARFAELTSQQGPFEYVSCKVIKLVPSKGGKADGTE